MSEKKTMQQLQDQHPGLKSYMECISRAYLHSLASFSLSFACSYSVQRLLAAHLPYSKKGHILASSLLSAGIAYKVATDRALMCQQTCMPKEPTLLAIKD